MEKKSSRRQFFILALMFLTGFLVFILPIISELTSYRADEEEYKEIALEIRPPIQTPIPPPPVRTATPISEENMQPPHSNENAVVTQPTATTDNGQSSEALPVPQPEVEEEADSPAGTTMPGKAALRSPSPIATGHKPEPTSATAAITSTPAPPTSEPQPTIDFTACLAENKDFVAWITIPGTKIDYPVVRSDNTAYYLKHLFSGKESKLGCLFSLRSSDYKKPSKNIAIYGHHLSNSDAMFSTLLNYKKKSYYAGHSVIQLETLYGSRTYRIFAVVDMLVTEWDAATASFSGSEAFMRFVKRAQDAALYDTGIQVTASDHILTLITCDRSYGGASGRLLVMAVEE